MKHSATYHFCGIGGSGMLPLALIVKGMGLFVSGSDRSHDQGRMQEKFAYLESSGIRLFPQDGSGVHEDLKALIVSTAVEDTIPDVKEAKGRGVAIQTRANLLSSLFNDSKHRIAVAGTSGKTTVTGMIGFILKENGKDPTVMNGGIFKNYKDGNPYSSALVGNSGVFVTECDESDGSIALYDPEIAVLNNIALDHKSLDELNMLFSDFIGKAKTAVLNADHPGVMALKSKAKHVITYGIERDADIRAIDTKLDKEGSRSRVQYDGTLYDLHLGLPGRHNVINALAAMAACIAFGLSAEECLGTLKNFKGIWRRLDTVGTKGGITVIDDFAHNPDKIAATLSSLKVFPGRLLIFFQPHGYGFLKLVWKELADTFAHHFSSEDVLYLVQPYYAGGTVDRSIDSSHVVAALKEEGIDSLLLNDRAEIKNAILKTAKPGDRIVIMGARDDTLAEFAKEIYDALP